MSVNLILLRSEAPPIEGIASGVLFEGDSVYVEAAVGQGENGSRVWSLKELYSESGNKDGTVPFKVSVMGVSALMCLVGDEEVDWCGVGTEAVEEALSWQAHRDPVLSLLHFFLRGFSLKIGVLRECDVFKVQTEQDGLYLDKIASLLIGRG
ncbi:hypothetical protein QYF36_010804 [Acer negundo]|nr:hypothetical protein QYF36_010804 [Acer negundo]